MPEGPVVWTVGHGTRPIEDLVRLLRWAGIRRLVDVRTAPGSRRHPWFGREALARSLEEAGIGYEWRRELGGFRKPHPGSRHTALDHRAFQGYADHMETEAFRRALREVIEEARREPTAVMCAETLWWRCHRRMIADALTAAGCEVRHLLRVGEVQAHRLHPAARIDGDGTLVYDVGAQQGLGA
ncbi:MAG TPA: DUF488 domain-containing protein [Actinomycetota bacterium]|nr:DUF488 domain-containing protein [Actinomycetota bacterium]